MKKRIISLLIAVCMCAQMFPVAFAEDIAVSDGGTSVQEEQSETEIPDNQAAPAAVDPAQTAELQVQAKPEEKSQSVEQMEPTAAPTPTATPIPEAVPTPEATSAPGAEADGALPATTATTTIAPDATQAATLAEGPAEGATVIGSGECGENLTWTEYSDRTLIIEGTGPMDSAPWSSFVKTVQIQDGVTSIAERAFWCCYSLTNVSIPQSIKSIGNSAFEYCEKLSNIVIPNGVESIGNSAFYGCKSITSMVLPETLTSIGGSAFNSCSSLSKIVVPASVQEMGGDGTTLFSDCKLYSAGPVGSGSDYEFGWTDKIPDNAFHGCGNLTSISLPGTVTEIGEMAFRYCRSLTNIDLPDHLASIGKNAFDSCESLTSIRIPSGVTAIAPSLFSSCISLEEISIPEGITSIGTYAFSGCTSLCSVNIPSTVASIGEWAFYGCPNLKTAGPMGGGYDIELAWENSVPAYAFARMESLESLVVPEGVTSIGSYAFRECANLTKIQIPGSVTNLEKDAFVGCDGLVSAGPIGSGCNYEFGWEEKFPEAPFYSCPALTSIEFPVGTIEITRDLIRTAGNLTYLEVPASVTSIEDNAFADCTDLVTAGQIGSGCDYEFGWTDKIPDNAFSGSDLQEIAIPEGITTIGVGVFSGCNKLSHLVIPGSVTDFAEDVSGYTRDTFVGCDQLQTAGPIGSEANYEFGWTEYIPVNAFYKCDSLIEVTIPNSVSDIGKSAFSGCSGLTSIIIPDEVISIGDSAFSGCSGLTSVVIPDEVINIGDSAFGGCSSLTSVIIPDEVISIGDSAFAYCSSLTSITISDSVTSIKSHAFNGCTELTDIYFSGSEEEWNAITIGNNNSALSNATIHYNYNGSGGVTDPDEVVSSYHVGTLESAEGSHMIIDGTEYEVVFASLPVLPVIMVGRTVIYGLNDDGQVVICSAIQTTTGDVTQWEAENSRFFTNVGYCGIKEGVTNNEIFQNPEAFIGSNRCVSYVSLSDGYTIVDIEPVTTIAGAIRNVDVLNDPWQVYLEDQTEPYNVDMTDEALQIKLTDLIGQMAVLTLVDNKITYAYTPAEATAVQVRLNIAPNNFVWSNGVYNMDTANATLTILYNPADTFIGDETALSSYSLSINEIDFSLDGMELLTFTGPAQLQPEDSIPCGESRQYSVALQIQNAQLDKEPEDGLTGTLMATIYGEKLGEVVNTSRSVLISITNEDIRNAAEEELERAEEKAAQAAYDAYNSVFANLSNKIALPPQLNMYLDEEQIESLKVIILSEIAMANVPEEVWTDRLSHEVTERVLSKFLGYTKPDVTADATEIPISVVVETEEYGSVQVDFLCDLTEFSLSESKFALFGSIETSVKLLDKKGFVTQTFQGGIITKCDINNFAEGVWNVAGAQLQSGYNEVWGNDADKIANNLIQAGIEKIANKVSPYFFQLPVEQILQQLYEHKFKDKLSSTMFKILCAPSKTVAVHCPVDLLVYDNENALVASIENNEITRENEKVALWTDGDSKYAQLFDDSYTISYRATGTGTMDVEITEEANDTSPMRVVSFLDVPLGNGIIYAGMVDDTIQPDKEVYALQSNLGNVITPTSVNKPVEEPIPEPEPDPEPVITPTDDPTILNQTFAGGTLDVTKLFELSNDAGATTYTLLNSGTGAGTLTSDGTLTVSKAGTFVVQVTTEATDATAAGSAQVTLTVNKGQGGGTLQVADITYPATAQPTIQNNVSGGTVTYYYNTTGSNQDGTLWTTDVVLDASEYWMCAQIAATDLYEAYTTPAVRFTVRPATVDQLDLTYLITAPVRGATPQVELTAEQFAGTILWSDTPDVFAPETSYTATVKLTAAKNYTLDSLGTDSFTYTGATVNYDPTTQQVTIVFPATDGRIIKSFTVTGAPAKTTYNLGEVFDTTGLTLTVTYDDGTTETITGGYNIEPAVVAADTTQVVISYGGVKANPITGLTVRENLVSIQALQAVTGLPNGTEKTAKALGLPETVKITTSRTQNPTTEVAVTWDVENCGYDPDSKSAQTFTVQGMIALPDEMTNLQNVPLTIGVSVEVKANDDTPENPDHPSDSEDPTISGNTESSGVSSSSTVTSEAQSASDDAGQTNDAQKTIVPQTSDTFPATGLIVLMAVSFVAVLALMVKRKKKQ